MLTKPKARNTVKSMFRAFIVCRYLYIFYTLLFLYVFIDFHKVLLFINIHNVINNTIMLYYTYKVLPVRCTNEYCTFCSYNFHLYDYHRDNCKLSL